MSKRMDDLAKRSRFRIGDIPVHPDRCVIIKDGVETSLRPLTMSLLVHLAHAKGEIVGRNDLLKNVWKNEYLDDNPITKEISELRDKLGDDRSCPRYIRTVRSEGYRTEAVVVFPKDYRPQRRRDRSWFGGSPYVGLSAFDATHADVFFGRERMCEKVLKAMSAQLDGGRFVLLHGASGSGKSSLLHAGVIPRVTREGSSQDPRALAVAHCDLASAQPGDALGALAAALASWTLDDRPVFPPQQIEDLKYLLIEKTNSIEYIIDEAFRLHTDRKVAQHPLAHLLLVIDHGEKLVDASHSDPLLHERFSSVLAALCGSKHVLTAMIVRGDFYQKLQDALPSLMELKGSQGHIDVMRPSPREIEEMICAPAECAGLYFERDPETGDDLDYRLREDARGKPDVLPLLQHTLNQLYENRDQENNLLTFAAYNEMGGLEGGIAHRAEEVFTSLPLEVQDSLDDVLSLLIEVQDTGIASGRRIPYGTLNKNSLALVQAFITARLFACDGHSPTFGVTHEALLRRWPKAEEWIKKNHQLLHARKRLKRAAYRWDEDGRKSDHLLQPGRPLSEAVEVCQNSKNIEEIESRLIAASLKKLRYRQTIRLSTLILLGLLTLASIQFAFTAEDARQQAETHAALAIEAKSLAESEKKRADLRLEESNRLANLIVEDPTYQKQKKPANKNNADDKKSIKEILQDAKASELKGDHATAAENWIAYGDIMMLMRSDDEALKAFRSANHHALAYYNTNTTCACTIYLLGQTAFWLGYYEYRKKNLEKAQFFWETYLNLGKKYRRLYPNDRIGFIEISYALNNLGTIERDRGRIEQAITLFQNSAEIKKQAISFGGDDGTLALAYIDSISWVTSAKESRGQIRQASKEYSDQVNRLKLLHVDEKLIAKREDMLAKILQLAANNALNLGDTKLAEIYVNESISRILRSGTTRGEEWEWRHYLSSGYLLSSEIEHARNNTRRSLSHLGMAYALSLKIRDLKLVNMKWRRLNATISIRASYAQNSKDSILNMDLPISDLAHLAQRHPDDMHTHIALAEALILRGKKKSEYGQRQLALVDWENAEKALLAFSKKTSEIKVSVLLVSAKVLQGKNDETRAELEALLENGYRRPEFLEIIER